VNTRDWRPVKNLQIAIDGPSGSGKGTIASMLGQELGLPVLDTGLLYRFIGWVASQQACDLNDELAVLTVSDEAIKHMQWHADGIYYQQQNCTSQLRTETVGALASQVASMPKVRKALLKIQQSLADQGAIMDGRDIGTVILPKAQAKFFLTASLRERARRRWRQLSHHAKCDMHDKDSMAEVEIELQKRDKRDANREYAPLQCAKDAMKIDSTIMDVDQVTDRILAVLERRNLITQVS